MPRSLSRSMSSHSSSPATYPISYGRDQRSLSLSTFNLNSVSTARVDSAREESSRWSPNMIKGCSPSLVWDILEGDTTFRPHGHDIYLSSGKRLLQRAGHALLPSFLRSNFLKLHRLHPTSYLDGLRGVASFIVFMGHYTEANMGWYTEPYGLYEDGAPSSPLQLPIVRVIYSARPMVHIFFIISGYVLSYKPLKQIHSHQFSALSSTLASSVFRRGIRLFLPPVANLFLMAILTYCGITGQRYASEASNLWEQLMDALNSFWDLLKNCWIFKLTYEPMPKYNPALWTIPVEFTQSLILFVAILGLSRCLTNARLLLLVSLSAFCFFCGNLYSVEFLGGMFIAELTLLHDPSHFSPTSSPTIIPKFIDEELAKAEDRQSTTKDVILQELWAAFWVVNLISGLFISSWTNAHPDELWGLRFLNAHTPNPYKGQSMWFCLGAFQIVGASTQLSFLKDLFTSHLAQYLGRISYALYLTHNMCLQVLEPRVAPFLYKTLGSDTFWGRHATWVAALTLHIPVVVFVSDVFMRAVDIPTVKFARWLETKCLVARKEMM